MKKITKTPGFVFFGSSKFSCIILDELKAADFFPSLIVTTPDKPKGRKLVIAPPPTKIWANNHDIPCLQPESLVVTEVQKKMVAGSGIESAEGNGLFIVASYGKIIPQAILDIPKHGILNVHPSLLPKLRGATPIQSAILTEDKTGVTIILLDSQMDHGPIVAQEIAEISVWPPYANQLEEKLAKLGGKLLAKIIPDWIGGKIKAMEQNHNEATYTKKITKEDGLIDLAGNPEENLKKIRAYAGWPNAYYFIEKNGKKIRVVIKEAVVEDGKLKLTKVIPEGKKEMPYEDFLRGFK